MSGGSYLGASLTGIIHDSCKHNKKFLLHIRLCTFSKA